MFGATKVRVKDNTMRTSIASCGIWILVLVSVAGFAASLMPPILAADTIQGVADEKTNHIKNALHEWLRDEIEQAQAIGDDKAVARLRNALDQAREKSLENFRSNTNDKVPYFPLFGENPYAKAYIKLAEEFEMPDHQRGAEYYESLSSQRIRRYAYDLLPLVWAVCSEQSPHYRDASRIRHVLASLDALLNLQKGGDYNAGRDSSDPNMTRFIYATLNDAYLMLTSTYPDMLPPALQEDWEQHIRKGAEHQEETFTERKSVPHGPFWYPNIDSTYTLQMYLAGIILGENDYIFLAEQRAKRLKEIMQPDGAWPYLGLGNEEPAYHGVVLKWLLRYYQLSDDPNALQAIRQSAPYYPLSTEAGGVASGSPSPYWKHRWDTVEPIYPDAVASIADCSMNKAVANDIRERFADPESLEPGPLASGPSFYDPEIEAAELADNFIVYDRNIEGPRGRFGHWSFTATGRDLEDDRGKYTFVGALVTKNDEQMIYPLSGALKLAFFEYLPKSNPESRIHLTMKESNNTIIAKDAAAFTVNTMMQSPQAGGGRSDVKPWEQNQIWLMTEERMAGFMELFPGHEQEAYGRAAILRLGEGRGLPFVQRHRNSLSELIQHDEREFHFGDLRMRVIDHNFDHLKVEKGDDRRYSYRGHWADVRLYDAGEGERGVYTRDDRRFVLVEIHPEWVEPADRISWNRLEETRYVLECVADGREMKILYDEETGRSILHGAGETQPAPFYERRFCVYSELTESAYLFNLDDDPGETNDLSEDYPDKLEEMEALLERIREAPEAVPR